MTSPRPDNRIPGWVIACIVGATAVALLGVLAMGALVFTTSGASPTTPLPPELAEVEADPEASYLDDTPPVVRSTETPPAEPAPRVRVDIDDVGDNPPNAKAVVSRMRSGFRRCYKQGLKQNPKAKGSIRLVLNVGPNGEVANAKATPTGDLEATAACCKSRATAAQFAPPDGGKAELVISLTFVSP